MKHLRSLNKYFVRYRKHFLLGMLFVTVSNLFAVFSPTVVRDVINNVQREIKLHPVITDAVRNHVFSMVLQAGLMLLGLAIARGIFMFLMRQTIIVMSRHIEFDQKNEIFTHYQQLHTHFYKTHFTGDLMNRMSEDVSRVRSYTGPSIMYAINLTTLSILCIFNMMRESPLLTLFVVLPLPLLAFCIYYVNKIIYRKSEHIQSQLSDLTTTAQESYSGIRVIKSFVQEKNMLRFFNRTSEDYRKSAINLSMTEAIYFPSMNFFIGLSMLATVLVGGFMVMDGRIASGNIAEFIFYINLLMFPISSIGWVASMTQRGAASQKRINEFMDTLPEIVSPVDARQHEARGAVAFRDMTFTYPHTGITALKHFNLDIRPGQKVAVIGKTGSGKSTLAHMLLRMYDPQEGSVLLDDIPVKEMDLQVMRNSIGYAPQEAFLFSDTIFNNIRFGRADATEEEVKAAARMADLERDIHGLANGYETVVGERGVMLSGGQKQRMVLARALLKNAKLLLLDECLSAVDTRTEKTILENLRSYLADKTTIVITHRIFTSWTFDQIIVLDDGAIVEQGTHDSLMALNGRYAHLFRHQTES